MSPLVRLVIPAMIALALSACEKLDPSSLFSGKDTTGPTPAQITRAGDLDPIFANPQRGDLYAAELTYFSGADFGQSEETAFGLMRIVAVHPDRIILNTETNAWSKARGAINEMRGDLAGIVWDEDEEIVIYRNELPHLVAGKKILDARRME